MADTRNKRTTLEKERDRAEVTSLYIQGWPQRRIGDHLGLTQQQISYDLGVIRKQWREDTARALDADKAEQLARIDTVEREAWKAWERSCGERTIEETSRSEIGADARTRAVIRKEQRDGNPAFIEAVLKCIDRRCKLLGLDAEVGSPDRPFTIEGAMKHEPDLSSYTDDQIDAILAVHEAEQLTSPAGQGGQEGTG